jgi:hypothetical protein
MPMVVRITVAVAVAMVWSRSSLITPSSHLLPGRSAMADEAAGSGCHPVAASVDG